MKVQVTIKETRTASFDAGALPAPLIKALLEKNEGQFNDTWGLGDVARDEKYTVDSVEVEQVSK